MELQDAFADAALLTLPVPALLHVVRRTVLGVPLSIEAASKALADAVETALPHAETAAAAPAVRAVLYLGEPEWLPLPEQRLHDDARAGNVLLFAGAGCIGRVQLTEQQSVALLHPALLHAPTLLRELIHALVLPIVTRLDRTPLHAAAVRRADAGLLLAGPSGSGKSTLAYAASAAGLEVISDDAVYVQLTPKPRIWALGAPIWLTSDAARWFPELEHRESVLRATGKHKIPITLAAAPVPIDRTGICLLRRSDVTQPRIHALNVEDAIAELSATLSPGFDAFRDELIDCVRAVARGGVWQLELSQDPRAAVPLVETILDQLARHSQH